LCLDTKQRKGVWIHHFPSQNGDRLVVEESTQPRFSNANDSASGVGTAWMVAIVVTNSSSTKRSILMVYVFNIAFLTKL
jgi:hypothetical protein